MVTSYCHDRPVPDDPYTLADLARLADVTPRTVRYYVAQGLLPSPEAAGPSTRYGEVHLARLRLIRRLQREHLPLAEIRARLSSMNDAEIATAAEPPAAEPVGGALDYVHSLMARSGVAPSLRPRAAAEARAPYAGASRAFRLRVDDQPPPAAAPVAATEPPANPAATQPDRSTWERLVITPDVELHVRRPLDRHTNRRVDQLERIARELLRDDV